MQKYWKFTSIIAVIVLSIGTFFVNSAMSATQYPEFMINKKSGNAEEIKSLVLEGGYHEGRSMSYTYNHLKITPDGSKYRNGSSLLDLVIGRPEPMIQELQDEYRNFMRGKGQNLDSFFENNKLLAYAEVKNKVGPLTSSDFKFAISILDKDDGNTTSYNIKVPDSSVVEYIYVEDVQVVDKELKMITQNMTNENEKYYNEKHIYTLDISTGTISSNETIFSIPNQYDTHIDAHLIKTNPKHANENLIFLITQSKITQHEESDLNGETSRELISYNIKTTEQKTIELPKSLKEHQISFFDGSTIYFSKLSEQNLVVTPFSIENDQAGNELTLQLSNETSNTEPPIIIVKDSKLYLTTQVTNLTTKASVAVFDVKTGQTLYEGEVERKGPPKNMEEFELYIYEVSVK